MPLALITGGTKGIGKAIAEKLQPDYDIVTVGRSSGATEQGDLQDPAFQSFLIEKYTPDLFVNNAAFLSKNLSEMMQMNGVIAVDMLIKFYAKMSSGIIVNIGSISAEKANVGKESDLRIAYSMAKKYLKDTSLALSYSKNKPIKVMCISPAATQTDMIAPLTNGYVPLKEHYDNYNWESSVCWTRPYEIANIVHWMINQPAWISIPELVVDNHYSRSVNW